MEKHLKWALISGMTVAFLIIMAPFSTEIFTAAVFAFALDPVSKRLASINIFSKYKHQFQRRRWVAITIVVLILGIVGPVGFALYNVYDSANQAASAGFQNTGFYHDIMNLKDAITHYGNALIEKLNLKGTIDLDLVVNNFTKQAGQFAVALSAKFLSELPQVILYIFVFCCSLYFFMAEQKGIRSFILKTQLINDTELDRITEIFRRSCTSTLFTSVVVGFIQASIVGIGSLVLRVGDFFVVFVVTFFLSFIPVIGAAPVAVFLGILALIKQDYEIFGGFMVVALVAGTIDNVIRPILVGNKERVHPIIVLLSLLGAIAIFGIPGLFLGPVIATVTTELYFTYVFERQSPSPETPAPTVPMSK